MWIFWVWESLAGLKDPGEGNGNPLQNSCMKNSMDWGAWQATYRPWGRKESNTTEQLTLIGLTEPKGPDWLDSGDLEATGQEWDPGQEAWMSAGLHAADNGECLKVLEQRTNRTTGIFGKLDLGLLQNWRGKEDQTGSQRLPPDAHWHPWPEVYERQTEEAFWRWNHTTWPLAAAGGQGVGAAGAVTESAAWIPKRMAGQWRARENSRVRRFAEKEEESPFGPLESQLKSFLPKAHTLCGSANTWGLPPRSPQPTTRSEPSWFSPTERPGIKWETKFSFPPGPSLRVHDLSDKLH